MKRLKIDFNSYILISIALINCCYYVSSQMLNPPYFNLAEGRNITASSTCGEDVPEPELYCKLVGSNWLNSSDNVNLIEGQACDYCDPNDPKRSHPAKYANDGTENWWQSPPLSRGEDYENVNLTIHFGQEFHVAYVFIKMGNSPKPGVWALERSRDYGKTYTPWQFFADTPIECIHYFGPNALQPITRDDSVICETKFSKLVPLEGGEILISILNGRPSSDNFSISTTLQEWSTATNIRLRFLRHKTTLGHLLSVAKKDPTVTRRYFYSIKDINIGGRCVCNGHASECDQILDTDPYKISCRCQHNTCGQQCEKCCNGFHQYEWRRGTTDLFGCEKCNCNGHSNDCYYDPEIASKNMSMNIHGKYEGGGVCLNCQHHTTGINCHECQDGYYRPFGKPLDDIEVCQPCECNSMFFTGNCFKGTGKCECRKNYQGPDCDKCSYGYFGYPTCEECHCYPNGTNGNVCELTTGSCPCKEGYGGKFCKECSLNYFGFPDCQSCDCHLNNAIESGCNSTTGQCQCKTNFGGRTCEKCSVGYYNYPKCEFCQCDRTGSTEDVCDSDTGKCFCKPGYDGPSCSRCAQGYYGFPECVKCDCNAEGTVPGQLPLSCDKHGKCECKSNYGGIKCNDCSPGYYNFPQCVPCNCNWIGSSGISCDISGNCVCKNRFDSQKCDKCKEGYYNFPSCEECNCNPAGLVAEFGGCDKVEVGKLCECKERVKGKICNQCKDLYWNLQMQNPYGCEKCSCNTNGTLSGIGLCDSQTGKCICKQNVRGRTCDTCKVNTYQLSSSNLFGCVDCDCDLGGSISSDCDKVSGQCRCKPRITGRSCSETKDVTYFPTFYQFIYEVEDWFNPSNSPARFGYDENIFPGHSWRGYATFNELQKEIYTNISISKLSLYKVIVHYVNKNDVPVNGVLTLKPDPQSGNEDEQKINIVFEPSIEPKLQYISGKPQAKAMVSLSNGPWQMFLKVEKYDLYIDYIVLIPQAYYDQTLFKNKITSSCLLDQKLNSCIQYSYPQFPPNSKFVDFSEISTENNEQAQPEIITIDEYKKALSTDRDFVNLNNDSNSVGFDISKNDNETYLIILNYHTPSNLDQEIILQTSLINMDLNKSLDTENILPACPYSFVCRQILTTNEGKFLIYDAQKNESNRLRITLANDPSDQIELNINSITLVLFDYKSSFDYIKPKFVCLYKDPECISQSFSSTPGGLKIEGETEQKRDRIITVDSYKHSSISDGKQKPELVKLKSNDTGVDIQGSVSRPDSYSIILHYYQPENSSFESEVLIQDMQLYSAFAQMEHCPNIDGCRTILKHRDTNSTNFFIQKNFMITLKSPQNSEYYLDYVLIVPEVSLNENLLTQTSRDISSTNVLSKCFKDNFYIDPSNASDYCRSAIFSIAVNFNGGALPCGCNPQGSVDHRCDSFGGQCKCKPNVIGRDCTMCRTGYYGFPNCRKCECPSTAICHTKTGSCICPKGVTGKDCDKCLPLTFGFHEILGCFDCACNPHGVQNRDLNCDLKTGNCKCKTNIVGRTCDKCQAGFFSFPRCELCSCEFRGATSKICNPNNGKCFCKENVEGVSCEKCKEDSYNLQESNHLGCTKCFCFGNTDRCTSSTYVLSKVRTTNQEWDLFNLTISEHFMENNLMKKNDDYEMDHNDGKFIIRTSILKEISKTNQDVQSSVYIALPKEYLGNKITSYGSTLNYTIANNINSNEPYNALSSPDLVLVGKHYTLVYHHIEQPLINKDFQFSIDLIESEFNRFDGSSVTREQFMMTLVNLQAVYIRVKYFDPIFEIVLSEVLMNIAIPDSGYSNETKALSVEQCNCPLKYKGTSCEECAEGYYRSQKGPYLSTCVKCNCNGHSNECDPDTGECFNCKANTEGKHCERCIAGYHGDATQGTPNDCLICACPSPLISNNFATSCEVSSLGSVLSCNCKDGYNGTRCERCAAGHYGQPLVKGDYCKECQCNDNIDPTDPDSCQSETGVCQKCLYNSAGEHCERCAEWYFGDSILSKNCTECDCDQCGSEYCDHTKGNCKCKTNVMGSNCDKCAVGFYGFSTCNGCKACNCNEGAYNITCDESGQCNCKVGVTGKTCNTCMPGYWGYSKYGCTSCECNKKYSRTSQCNQSTGQCQCLPGVVGEKCEKCPDRWVLDQELGCQECGNCVHVLLNDTESLQDFVEPFKNDIQDTSILAYKKLTYFESKYKNFSIGMQKTFENTPERLEKLNKFSKVKSSLNNLVEEIEKNDIKCDSMEKDALQTLSKVMSAYNESINCEANVKAVKELCANIVEKINLADSGNFNTLNIQDQEQKKKESEKILIELKKPLEDYSATFGIHLEKFEDTLENANKFVTPSVVLKNQIAEASNRLHNMTNIVIELKNLTLKARENTVNAERIFKGTLKESIQNNISFIEKSVAKINTFLSKANSFNDKRKLKLDLVESKYGEIEKQKTNLESKNENLKVLIENLINSFPETYKYVNESQKHVKELQSQIQNLNKRFVSTKNQAIDAMLAANAYNNISDAIINSEDAINNATSKLNALPEDLDQLKVDIEQISNKTKIKIDMYLSKHSEQNSTVNELDDQVLTAYNTFTSLNNLENNQLTGLDQEDFTNITQHVDEVNNAESKLKSLIDSIETFNEQSIATKHYSEFTNDVKESQDYIKRLRRYANSSNSEFTTEIDYKRSDFNKMKNMLSIKIAELKKQIQLARHHTNNIRVGVEFASDSALELNNPTNLVESSTYSKFQMEFHTLNRNGLLAYIGNPADDNQLLVKRGVSFEENLSVKQKQTSSDFMSLEIRDGKVHLIWNLGTDNPEYLSDSQFVSNGSWSQVIVERFGKLFNLLVITEQNKTQNTKTSLGYASVLNLDSYMSKLFIGGIFPQVKIDTNIQNRHFEGVISNVMFNNEPLGLWNLNKAINIKGARNNKFFTENSLRFRGDSYVILPKNKIDLRESMFVNFYFKTFSKNGLLFLVGDPNIKNYFAIEINDGRIAIKYELGSSPTTVWSNNDTFSDGKWHKLQVNRDGKECFLSVDSIEEGNGFGFGMNTELSTDDNIYIGGYPGIVPYIDVIKTGFQGCIKDLQIHDSPQNLNNNKESMGVLMGCSSDFVRVASFTEQVNSAFKYVLFDHQQVNKDSIQLTFKFRTLSKTGLLIYATNNELDTSLTIYMINGMLVLLLNQEEVIRTKDQYYNDNQWHYITIDLNKESPSINIDDSANKQFQIENFINFMPSKLTKIYVGGLSESMGTTYGNLFGQFTGCIGDITLNEKFINFAEATEKHNTQFSKCPLSVSEEDFSLSNIRKYPTPETYPTVRKYQYLPPIGNCKLPPIPKEDFKKFDLEEVRFGDTLWSRYEFPISNDVSKGLENESGFQIEFKTTQANGIVFYITSSNNIDFVGLYFINNKLHYSFDCGSGRGVVSVDQNYSDGQWHTATFSRKGKNGLLRVDSETLDVTSVGSTSSLNVKSPIYVGGVPEELSSQVKGHLKSVDKNDYSYAISSFSGCLRNLKIRDLEYNFKNGQDFNVASCSEPVESGHFFHYDGGYIRLFDEFRVKVQLTMTLEIKPRKPDGILAAVFGEIDFLVLYMDKGKIILSVDNGANPIIATKDMKGQLCDGHWHTIKVVKMKNMAMLTIDNKDPIIQNGAAGISSTDTKDPLYIGGLPDKLKEKKKIHLNSVTDDYLGCMRVKEINGVAPTFSHVKTFGHITLNSCPLG